MPTKRHFQPPYLTKIARRLQRDASVPERLLWGVLRSGRLGGLKFRRQNPIGPYIVDFVCYEKKLVVELDGLSHVGHASRDTSRTRYLEGLGYRVLRFTNDEVIADAMAVAEAIARAVGADP
jgi:very-short-patch-repair endonuclease